MNWRKWKAGKEKRSERARKGAAARWARVLAGREGEAIRRDRVVELRVADTHRPWVTVRLTRIGNRGRWEVREGTGGGRIGGRKWGRTGVARLIAGWLE